jgi:L-alanine-DL-glutamate epimerase-like enolase superfamily enzyme
MHISSVEVYRVELPFQEVAGTPLRTWQPAATVGLVRAQADNGLVGVGTGTAIGFYLALTGGGLIDGLVTLAPILVGRSPFDLETIHGEMERLVKGHTASKAAFDMALHDLAGQVAGRPVYDLLGGRSQAAPMPTTCFALYVDTPENMAAEVRRFYDEGFRAFEVKMDNPPLDVARIRAIREAVGEGATLIADANGQWDIKGAIRTIRQLERYNVIVEEPCTGVTALEEVRRAVDVPIVADETCHTLADAAEIVRRRAADLLSIKIMKCGGLHPAKKMAALAESAGLGYRVDGVRGETRVSNTATAHLATALRFPVAPGFMQHRRLQDDVVKKGGLIYEAGRVSVPDAPGLGLECPPFGERVARFDERVTA